MIQHTIDHMAGESVHQDVLFGFLRRRDFHRRSYREFRCGVRWTTLIAVFWCMDAQYLAQEHWFRDLYGAALTTLDVNFVMTPSAEILNLHGLRQTLLGWSTVPLYGALEILCLLTLALWIVLS
jgi:hypothetical protein